MHWSLLAMFTPQYALIVLTSLMSFVSVHKTACCRASICFTVWPVTHDVTNTFYIYRDVNQPQSPPVSQLSSGRWLNVSCKHCERCWVFVGLPQCAHRKHICFDLGSKLSAGDTNDPPSFPSYFLLHTIFLKLIEQASPQATFCLPCS